MILVTGGAGYIGMHILRELCKAGKKAVVYDNVEMEYLKHIFPDVVFVKGDLADVSNLKETIEKYGVDSVIHLAASSLVGESMKNPDKYFENNIINGLNLLNVMKSCSIKKIVFSSTASVYGSPEKIPINEEDEIKPTNPYGFSKAVFEGILKWYDSAYNIKYISLRYFNAAGADLAGDIGEDHEPETHLIPIILQAALGKREKIEIFGTDYNTKDSTCIRDYIHVTDIARAHLLALDYLDRNKSTVFNLGSGSGFSVREIINTAAEVTGRDIKVIESARRPGDPTVLVAGNEKAAKELRWGPKLSDIKTIISSAWKWHSSHPNGFSR